MNPREKSDDIKKGNKVHLRILIVLFLIGFSLCIHQDTNYEKLETDVIQPELSDVEFIELVNNILIEKVSLKMFDKSYGQYTYVRNTYDNNGEKIHISVRRYRTDINIYVDNGHLNWNPQDPQPTPPPVRDTFNPQMIDVRGLFTPQIESQVDLTPPSKLNKERIYNISVMGYNGTFEIWRTSANIYFRNIGGVSPTPTPPRPKSFISQIIYYGFICLFIFIIIIGIYGIYIIRRRRTS